MRYFYGDPAKEYYAKPEPLVLSPWADDSVAGDQAGGTSSFGFDVPGHVAYAIFERVGGSPDSSDPIVGELTPGPPPAYAVMLSVGRKREFLASWLRDAEIVSVATPTIEVFGFDGASLTDGEQAMEDRGNGSYSYQHHKPIVNAGKSYFVVLKALIDGAEREFPRLLP